MHGLSAPQRHCRDVLGLALLIIYTSRTHYIQVRLKQVYFERCCGSHKINHLSEHQKASCICRLYIQIAHPTTTPTYSLIVKAGNIRTYIYIIHKYERRYKVASTHDHHFLSFLYIYGIHLFISTLFTPYVIPKYIQTQSLRHRECRFSGCHMYAGV